MAFGLTPAGSGFPPQAPDSFPNYIQFQSNGTNLGAPNVDIVDFADGLVATRGTGENANKVAVHAGTNPSGGAAAAEELVVALNGATNGTFNGASFSDWTGTVLHSSTDASWNETSNQIDLQQTGLYEVTIEGRVTPQTNVWPAAQGGFTYYGSEANPSVGGVVNSMSQSRHGLTVQAAAGWQANGLFAQFHDKYVVNVPSLAAAITPTLYANAYTAEADVAVFAAVVTVRRIGPAV